MQMAGSVGVSIAVWLLYIFLWNGLEELWKMAS